MVTVNGNALPVDGQTLSQFLDSTDFDPRRIAVERNGDIVPKAQEAATGLKDGDCVEVVSFVGGG